MVGSRRPAKWTFQYEVGRRAQADTSEASVRRFYEENADLYARTDGELTPLSVVAGSIRSSMLRHAETATMDELIAELRQRHAHEIDVDDTALERAVVERSVPILSE